QRVGPQKPDTILNLLQAAANADGGLLLEDRWRSHGPGLVFRERSSMYNQEPAVVLSYDQAAGLAAPLDVVDDDTSVRNDRTGKIGRAAWRNSRSVRGRKGIYSKKHLQTCNSGRASLAEG